MPPKAKKETIIDEIDTKKKSNKKVIEDKKIVEDKKNTEPEPKKEKPKPKEKELMKELKVKNAELKKVKNLINKINDVI